MSIIYTTIISKFRYLTNFVQSIFQDEILIERINILETDLDRYKKNTTDKFFKMEQDLSSKIKKITTEKIFKMEEHLSTKIKMLEIKVKDNEKRYVNFRIQNDNTYKEVKELCSDITKNVADIELLKKFVSETKTTNKEITERLNNFIKNQKVINEGINEMDIKYTQLVNKFKTRLDIVSKNYDNLKIKKMLVMN
tara:strand:- start:388 stop:972 length:585 start_codon:yes stop_codon:yes gene_type:complete